MEDTSLFYNVHEVAEMLSVSQKLIKSLKN